MFHELCDGTNGEPVAILEIAWLRGVQEELTEPVAIEIDEPREVVAAAGRVGVRCFSSVRDFKRYVQAPVLSEA